MKRNELEKILVKHSKWLRNEEGGECGNLMGADLGGVDLSGVDLMYANLSGADLRWADLSCANLMYANLMGANLRWANLRWANLKGADLGGAKIHCPIACPEKGSFTAFKKASGYIVELLIPSDAKRCSATSRKCRCDKAEVVSITSLSGDPVETTSVASSYDRNFIYTVGECVTVPEFDEDRWNECSTGIHFFITRDEAVNY